jgi:hypothetical protein
MAANEQSSIATSTIHDWRRGETNAEHQERVEAAEKEARWYFEQATKPQHAAALEAKADAYRDTPRYAREIKKINAAWSAATADAWALREFTAEEILRDGEVSEATSERWDALIAKQAPVPTAHDIVNSIRATSTDGKPVLSLGEAALMVTLFAAVKHVEAA